MSEKRWHQATAKYSANNMTIKNQVKK